MLALQPVEADPSRFDPPHGSSDVAQLSRIEVDRVIRRRAEIGDRPGARMPDRRGKDRGRRRVVVLRCARLKDCRHCSGLQLFHRICTAETAPVQPGTAARARATAKSAAGAVCAGSPRTLLATVPVWIAQRPLSARRATFAKTHRNEREAPIPDLPALAPRTWSLDRCGGSGFLDSGISERLTGPK